MLHNKIVIVYIEQVHKSRQFRYDDPEHGRAEK